MRLNNGMYVRYIFDIEEKYINYNIDNIIEFDIVLDGVDGFGFGNMIDNTFFCGWDYAFKWII